MKRGLVMEELLFGLTPSEFWVWNYLVYLVEVQRSCHIILPRPGEDLRAEKVFCRKHLKRILKSLRAKFHLTNLLIHRSKSKQIEVLVPASKIGDMGVPNVKEGCNGVSKNRGWGMPGSPIANLGTTMSPISEVITGLLPDLGPGKLKLKEVIEKIIELKQRDLKMAITSLGPRTVYELGRALEGLVRVKPKGKKLSIGARVFAMVRFLQSGADIEKPQAWIDNVARAVERELWSEKGKREPGKSYGGRPGFGVLS
jgi:hypothetical protein